MGRSRSPPAFSPGPCSAPGQAGGAPAVQPASLGRRARGEPALSDEEDAASASQLSQLPLAQRLAARGPPERPQAPCGAAAGAGAGQAAADQGSPGDQAEVRLSQVPLAQRLPGARAQAVAAQARSPGGAQGLPAAPVRGDGPGDGPAGTPAARGGARAAAQPAGSAATRACAADMGAAGRAAARAGAGCCAPGSSPGADSERWAVQPSQLPLAARVLPGALGTRAASTAEGDTRAKGCAEAEVQSSQLPLAERLPPRRQAGQTAAAPAPSAAEGVSGRCAAGRGQPSLLPLAARSHAPLPARAAGTEAQPPQASPGLLAPASLPPSAPYGAALAAVAAGSGQGGADACPPSAAPGAGATRCGSVPQPPLPTPAPVRQWAAAQAHQQLLAGESPRWRTAPTAARAAAGAAGASGLCAGGSVALQALRAPHALLPADAGAAAGRPAGAGARPASAPDPALPPAARQPPRPAALPRSSPLGGPWAGAAGAARAHSTRGAAAGADLGTGRAHARPRPDDGLCSAPRVARPAAPTFDLLGGVLAGARAHARPAAAASLIRPAPAQAAVASLLRQSPAQPATAAVGAPGASPPSCSRTPGERPVQRRARGPNGGPKAPGSLGAAPRPQPAPGDGAPWHTGGEPRCGAAPGGMTATVRAPGATPWRPSQAPADAAAGAGCWSGGYLTGGSWGSWGDCGAGSTPGDDDRPWHGGELRGAAVPTAAGSPGGAQAASRSPPALGRGAASTGTPLRRHGGKARPCFRHAWHPSRQVHGCQGNPRGETLRPLCVLSPSVLSTRPLSGCRRRRGSGGCWTPVRRPRRAPAQAARARAQALPGPRRHSGSSSTAARSAAGARGRPRGSSAGRRSLVSGVGPFFLQCAWSVSDAVHCACACMAITTDGQH
jgi:hypothetical protein